jgi:HD-like signal output (HDOD) protein
MNATAPRIRRPSLEAEKAAAAPRVLVVREASAPGNVRPIERRDGWDVVDHTGADDAVSEIGRAPFDVVVADAEVADRRGVSILDRVREIAPATTRIAIVGADSKRATRAALMSAHQVLPATADPSDLRAAISNAAYLRSVFAHPRLQKIVGGTSALPSPPKTYFDLTNALRDPEVGMAEVSAIIASNTTLSARILQLVNSPFFGLRRSISQIHEAVVLLGAERLRTLALGLEAFRAFEGTISPDVIDLEEQQAHATAVAELAAKIARADRASTAFTAGLLHDIGYLVLAVRAGKDLAQLRAHEADTPGFEIQRRVWGFTHAEVGGYLLGMWGVPLILVEAVARHHSPNLNDGRTLTLTAVSHVADALSHEASGDERGYLDEHYLAQSALDERLPGWRDLAGVRAR